MTISLRISSFNENIGSLVRHSIFQRFIIALIIFNAIALGFDTVPSIVLNYGAELAVIDHLIMAIFVLELALRIVVYRLDFFRDPWSIFDLIIVASALFPHSEVMGVLRILRVLRLLRLVGMMPSLRLIVGSLFSALPGMGSVMLLLSIVMYIGAVMVTKLFGAESPERFGDLGLSIFSLIQVTTMDSWTDIARAAMKNSPYAWIFFFGFIIVTTFTVMNLFVGVMVGSMQAKAEEDKAEKKRIFQERVNSGLEIAPVELLSADLTVVLKEIRLLHTEILEMRTVISSKK